MAVAETARLIASLELKDLFTKSVDNATKSLNKLDKSIDSSQGRAYKAGQQIGVGIKRGLLIAVGAATGLTALFIKIAKEGQSAADVQAIFAKAIQNSGKVTTDNVAALKAQEDALLSLSGVDDELIKTEQTRLIQMGLTGAQVLKLTPAILDFAKATGTDLLTATKLAGKAAEGNVTALKRYGIEIDKAKAKTDPFGATLDALNKKFGGTTAALSGSIDTKLNVFKERLQNIREEAGIKLLPALTRIIDTVTAKLLPAFQEFIDAILPGVISGLNKFADALQSGDATKGLTSVLNTIKVAAPIIQKSAEATFTIVKAAVDLFTSLPEGLQQLAVGAFAVNKLTGGLVTNVGGGIADFIAGKIGLLRGQTPATPLFVSDVTGGIGKGIPGLVSGGAGALPAAAGVAGVGAIVTAALPFLLLALPEIINPGFKMTPGFTGSVSPKGQGGPSGLVAAGNHTPDGSASNPIHVTAGGFDPGLARDPNISAVGGFDKRLTVVIKDGFTKMIDALRNAKGAKAIEAAVKEAVHQVIGLKKGSLDATKETVAGLRALLKKTSDPKLRADIKTALAKVQAKIPGREFAQKQIAIANHALADGKLDTAETKRVKTAIQQLKDRGLPHAAAVIQASVDKAKNAEVSASNETTSAIKAKDLSVTVQNAVQFSLRTFVNGTNTYSSFTRTARNTNVIS
jgi:hypothetical protein